MPDADSEPDVEHETWKVEMNLTYSMIIGIFKFFVFSGLLTYFIGKYWQKVGDLSRHVLRRYIEPVLLIIPYVKDLIGAKFKVKLLFVPDAYNKPDVKHEISEPALFRFLLNEASLKQLDAAEVEIPQMLGILKDIDKQSKIIEFETHQSSICSATDFKKAFHVFIVFKTKSKKKRVYYWWSLEKNSKYIVLQRSRNKESVKDKLEGEKRNKVKSITEDLKGKGTIQDLFEILWAQQLISEKYHFKRSNCQSLVTFVGKRITEEEYEYQGYFNYSPPERGWNKKMLDFIKILRGLNSCDYHPLFQLLFLGNTDLLDKMIASGKYDINAFYKGLTLLHCAIMGSKTEMVKHLLQHPLNADPTRREENGRNALQLAAFSTMKTEIFDLLLAHDKVKVDDVNKDGVTALHLAAHVSNVIAVRKLLENGASPNIVAKKSGSPLHLAAQEREGCPIIDLLLEAQKFKGMGDVNDRNEQGMTALHSAAIASNETTAEHLIKKGADVNRRDNDGITPLYLAALCAKEMKIIDLLLLNIKEGDIKQYRNDKKLFIFAANNKHGLRGKIVNRLMKKGIKPPSNETDEWTEGSDKATGINARRFEEEGADPSIDLTGFDGVQFLKARVKNSQEIDINARDQDGQTPLFLAIGTNNVNWVKRLLKRGADPTIHNNNGYTPFHVAATSSKDPGILNLLLKSGQVNINETISEHGITALHLAIISSNVTVARFLLSKGANPNVADENGLTPLHVAARNAKDMDIVELLVNHKDTDVNCLDNEGRNALDYARLNKKGQGERIANLLKKKGAVETENDLPTLIKESFKKHMRDYNNRKPSKLENIFSDDTVPIEDTLDKIWREFLASAIRGLNVESVRLLLKNEASDISARGDKGRNTLHVASFYAKTTDVIDVILETGKFDINGMDTDGLTPLHYAIMGSNVTTARYLLEKGADPTKSSQKGITPLHLAATFAKEMDIVKLLVNHKDTNVNYLDNEGNNALHYAMDNEHGLAEEIANLLKEKTVLLKAEGNNHEPENMAASVPAGRNRKDPKIEKIRKIRFLIEDGQDISAMTWGENGANALHVASANEKTTDLIDAILETGKFDINGVDNDGWTPLHYAIMGSNSTKNARHLIQLGADPNIANKNRVTPLHLAAKNVKATELIDIILETGQCNINPVDNDGKTPIHYAIQGTKRITINVRRLIKMGADPGIADKNGITPLHMAAIYAKTMDLIELLLNTKKLDVNDYDDNGLAAGDYAPYNKHGLSRRIIARLEEFKKNSTTELSASLSASQKIIFACICFYLLCKLSNVVLALQNKPVFMLKQPR